MKKVFIVFWFAWIMMGAAAFAATRGDVKVLEAADSIRYNTSKLTKEYLLYLKYPQKRMLYNAVKERFLALETDMHNIATSTKDPKTKGILKYFAFEKVRIEGLLEKKPSAENASELLDFSESFVEGAAAIAKRHSYVPAPEEEMWITTRSMDQSLEEVIKYYVAQIVIKDDPELKKKMADAKSIFTDALRKINQYDYTPEHRKTRQHINRLWKTLEEYLAKNDKLPLPLVSTMMGTHLESKIDVLGTYHNLNQ